MYPLQSYLLKKRAVYKNHNKIHFSLWRLSWEGTHSCRLYLPFACVLQFLTEQQDLLVNVTQFPFIYLLLFLVNDVAHSAFLRRYRYTSMLGLLFSRWTKPSKVETGFKKKCIRMVKTEATLVMSDSISFLCCRLKTNSLLLKH